MLGCVLKVIRGCNLSVRYQTPAGRNGRQKHTGLREETRLATVLLGQDDFVEQFDGGISGFFGLPVMNELAEGLSLLEHLDKERVLLRHTLEEALHVEPIDISSFFPITGGRQEKLAICIEKTGETSHKSRTDLVRVERDRTW